MQYEQTLALEPTRLDDLNRLLLHYAEARADGAILTRFGVQFRNEFVMQLWIVNQDPHAMIQAILWDHMGGRVGESHLMDGPVEGKYTIEFLADHYTLVVCEGPQEIPDGA